MLHILVLIKSLAVREADLKDPTLEIEDHFNSKNFDSKNFFFTYFGIHEFQFLELKYSLSNIVVI